MPCRVELGSETEQAAYLVNECLKEVKGRKHSYFQIDYYSLGFSTKNQSDQTRELCTLLKSKTPAQIKRYSKELQAWWKQHQADDRKRKRAD